MRAWQVPHIAAGDNLDLPLVGRLLRAAGAFFIRRAGGAGCDGALYRRVLAGMRSQAHTGACGAWSAPRVTAARLHANCMPVWPLIRYIAPDAGF